MPYGYIYDTDTDLYYLQSRYYDPEIGRFINADDITYLGSDGKLLSYNLLAYCQNNPVGLSDNKGNDPIIAASIGGATAGALISVVSYLTSAGNDAVFGEAALAFICGAIGGALGGAAGMATGDVKFACLFGVAVVGGLYSNCTGGSFIIGSAFSFLGAYAGTKLDTSMFTGFDLAAANYGTGVFTGFPAEIGSQITHSVFPQDFFRHGNTDMSQTGNGRKRPHNYVTIVGNID